MVIGLVVVRVVIDSSGDGGRLVVVSISVDRLSFLMMIRSYCLLPIMAGLITHSLQLVVMP